LYIGIPFCPSRCSYCSFTSFIGCKKDKIDEYIETLVYETEETIKMALNKGLILNTVYIGGGTPSILDEIQINKIFNSISKYYDLSKINEVTFEAGRPDTLTEEKLICLKKNNVSRISINPQTMNEITLQTIKRSHSAEDIIKKYDLAKKIGFQCINMDVILGLPGEDEKDVEKTIRKIIKLKPENITVHALAYKKKSELTRESQERLKDYDLVGKMHEIINKECQAAGYKPYYIYRQKNIKGNSDNIGFTLTGKESIYNMIIIEELETILACGLGASSKIKTEEDRHVPFINFKSLEEYKGRINEIISKKKEQLKIN
jgi:oxygen-independent coproporphyrinogen-3 oxidase